MTLPNFYLVGPPKCATTSIWYYLRQHPDVFLSEIKELYYFSCPNHPPSPSTHFKGFDWYVRQFHAHTHEHAVGEASTSYFFCSTARRRIQHHTPDAKLVVVLRDPVRRLFSHFQMVKRANGWTEDFSTFIAAENEWFRFMADVSAYEHHIRDMFDLFSRERVCILLTRDLKANPRAFMRTLCMFLEVDPSVSIDTSRQHGRYTHARVPWIDEILLRLNKAVMRVTYKSPRPIQTLLRKTRETGKRLTRFVYSDIPSGALLKRADYETLQPRFARDVAFIEEILDTDLSSWKSFD